MTSYAGHCYVVTITNISNSSYAVFWYFLTNINLKSYLVTIGITLPQASISDTT